jgi:hypothetical protein
MKQAEAEYKDLENDISTPEKEKMYWSSRNKYRTLKYEYNIQRTLIVFAILGLAGILYVAITRGVI